MLSQNLLYILNTINQTSYNYYTLLHGFDSNTKLL